MKAMLLAAGLGTRLRPLTNDRPKALVELQGRTLLEITITRLKSFGVTEVIINVHHHADMLIDYVKSQNNFNIRVEISREEILLDTGGGLKKAAWFFMENSNSNDPSRQDDPFLLHNVDILSTIDLAQMLQFHRQNQALATLAVQSRPSSRLLVFNKQGQLLARHTEGHSPLATPHSPLLPSEGPSPSEPLAFSGIHVLSPRLLPLLTETGAFSIIDSYLRLSAQNQKIQSFRADRYYWRDLGRPEDLAQAAEDLATGLPAGHGYSI